MPSSDAGEHSRDQDHVLCHTPDVVPAEALAGGAVSLSVVRRHLTCAICSGLVASSLVMNCSHVFCGDCLFQHLSVKPQCPQCQVNLRAIPVRCLALDAVSATFAKTLEPQAQARYEARAEEGKAAANKLNKMFWWLQSPMAVSGPDAVGGSIPGGAPPSSNPYLGGLQAAGAGLPRHPVPNTLPQGPSASLGGGAGFGPQGPGGFLGLCQSNSGGGMGPQLAPGQLTSSGSSGGGAPGRVRPPSQLAHPQMALPPQPKHLAPGGPGSGPGGLNGLNNPVSVPHGASERIARGPHSNSGTGPLAPGGHLHRRNSEGSNIPCHSDLGAGVGVGAGDPRPGITGRRSFCNGDSSMFPPLAGFGGPTGPGPMAGHPGAGMGAFNPLAFSNPLAELQQQYAAAAAASNGGMMLNAGLPGLPPPGMMMGGPPGLQEQAMVQQLLQQMYLGG